MHAHTQTQLHSRPLICAAASITAIVLMSTLAGCTHRIKVDPIKVEPIHVTVDINVKVDRELESFFDFEEKYDTTGNSTTEQGGS